jgi:putative transposase
MGHKYAITNKQGVYFITFATVGWIDVFTRKEYRDILIDNLKYCQQQKGLVIYAWCIMSNHVHLVAEAKEQNPPPMVRVSPIVFGRSKVSYIIHYSLLIINNTIP